MKMVPDTYIFPVQQPGATFYTVELQGPARFRIYIDIWVNTNFKTRSEEWFGKASFAEYRRPFSKEIVIVSHYYISSFEEVKRLVIDGVNAFFGFQWLPLEPVVRFKSAAENA